MQACRVTDSLRSLFKMQTSSPICTLDIMESLLAKDAVMASENTWLAQMGVNTIKKSGRKQIRSAQGRTCSYNKVSCRDGNCPGTMNNVPVCKETVMPI